MIKILKLVKGLLAKGFATEAEKAEVKKLFKGLEEDEQETVKDEMEKAEALPSNDPASDEGELEKNIKTIIGAEVKSATKAETSKAVDAIKSEVKEWLESQKSAIEAKAGSYNKSVAERRHGLNLYMRKFVSAVLNNDLAEMQKLNGVATKAELTTDSSGTPYGGYITGIELSAEIRALITEYGVARQEFTTIQLSKHRYDANDLATDVSITWVGEGSDIQSTQVVLGQESLTLKKLGAIVCSTRELLEDQEIDLFAFIATRVAQAFAKAEDTAFFMGAGVSDTNNGGFTGLLNNQSCNPVDASGTAFTDLTAEDLLSMQDESPQSVAKNGKYYMHRSIRNLIRKLRSTDDGDKTGLFIYQQPGGTETATLWGRPIVEVEVMPSVADSDTATPFVIYGDLKKSSILGYKGAMSMDRFNAGVVANASNNGDVNLITSDREAIRWVERVGAMTILPEACTVLSTKAS